MQTPKFTEPQECNWLDLLNVLLSKLTLYLIKWPAASRLCCSLFLGFLILFFFPFHPRIKALKKQQQLPQTQGLKDLARSGKSSKNKLNNSSKNDLERGKNDEGTLLKTSVLAVFDKHFSSLSKIKNKKRPCCLKCLRKIQETVKDIFAKK